VGFETQCICQGLCSKIVGMISNEAFLVVSSCMWQMGKQNYDSIYTFLTMLNGENFQSYFMSLCFNAVGEFAHFRDKDSNNSIVAAEFDSCEEFFAACTDCKRLLIWNVEGDWKLYNTRFVTFAGLAVTGSSDIFVTYSVTVLSVFIWLSISVIHHYNFVLHA